MLTDYLSMKVGPVLSFNNAAQFLSALARMDSARMGFDPWLEAARSTSIAPLTLR